MRILNFGFMRTVDRIKMEFTLMALEFIVSYLKANFKPFSDIRHVENVSNKEIRT